MTTKFFLSTFLVLTIASCDTRPTQNIPDAEAPKALQDKSNRVEILYRSGGEDLVESLYQELLSKNLDLKNLELVISDLKENQSDSTMAFNKFNGKNQSYFQAAIMLISNINDTITRDKMKALIENNLAKYNSTISKHTELRKIIKQNELTISDLHIILKIVTTLPLMEKYQKDNLPDTKSLEGYILEQEKVIKRADSLTKK